MSPYATDGEPGWVTMLTKSFVLRFHRRKDESSQPNAMKPLDGWMSTDRTRCVSPRPSAEHTSYASMKRRREHLRCRRKKEREGQAKEGKLHTSGLLAAAATTAELAIVNPFFFHNTRIRKE